MEILRKSRIHPLSFGHRMGNRFRNHLFNRDFLLGYDPLKDYPITEKDIAKANIKEHTESYVVEIPVPGYKEHELTIHLEDDILTIKGKKELDIEKSTEYIVREHDMDEFERSFRLGSITDQNNISASLRDGILYITLHHKTDKNNSSGAKNIPVE